MSNICRVAVGGLNPAGLFFLERLGLSTDFHVVGAFDSDPERLRLASGSKLAIWQQDELPTEAAEVDLVFLCDRVSIQDAAAAIESGKHVVIHQPWLLSSSELTQLHELARSRSQVAVITSVRRWSAEFLAAMSALQTGRIGSLRSARLCSLEKRIPDEDVSASVLREFGYAWFDQLLAFSPSSPARVYSRCFGGTDSAADHGFLAVVDFADGCCAQVEVITNSRLGHRTGWILEGCSGSYRTDRLFTETLDGEIVDEPIPKPTQYSADLFLQEVAKACRGKPSGLVSLADGARSVRLIEAIERSAETKQVVDVLE